MDWKALFLTDWKKKLAAVLTLVTVNVLTPASPEWGAFASGLVAAALLWFSQTPKQTQE